MNVEITQGYEKWKKLFLSVDAKRETYGIKVLAYGHAKDNENKIYQVLEMDSMDLKGFLIWRGFKKGFQ